MCRLLVDERVGVFHGACHSISNMAALGGISKAEMRDAVPLLVCAYNAMADDPGRHAGMSDLLRNVPPGVQSTAREHLDGPPAPVPPARTVVSLESPVYRAVQRLAEHHGRPEVREAAAALSLRIGDHAAVATAERWAMSGDVGEQVPGLVTLGHRSAGIDRRILEHTVRGDWGSWLAGRSTPPA